MESFARWKITPQGYTRGKKGQKGLKIRPPANTQGRNGNFLPMKKPFKNQTILGFLMKMRSCMVSHHM